MSRSHQVAPRPFARDLALFAELALPDDGRLIIETTGIEVLDVLPRANDNARCVEDAARVIPFATNLPRVP